MFCDTVYPVMEANGERASLAAKFRTPLRVGQRESGPKLHRAPVGVLDGGPLRSTAGARR
ncbi:unnamed protein product [Staurois parvus]|uniref:Uncharacterized protein n=1 Tax=Staurois parvus TaxID=386267 RepID=A0ABN9ERK7_9NEOB|nr:unnamed protein product [Staurois parvus]